MIWTTQGEGIERYLKRNPKTCFVAEKDNKIIGTILCGNDGRRGFIYHAAVSPEERNNGVGSALVEAALNALKKKGLTKWHWLFFQITKLGIPFGKKRFYR